MANLQATLFHSALNKDNLNELKTLLYKIKEIHITFPLQRLCFNIIQMKNYYNTIISVCWFIILFVQCVCTESDTEIIDIDVVEQFYNSKLPVAVWIHSSTNVVEQSLQQTATPLQPLSLNELTRQK